MNGIDHDPSAAPDLDTLLARYRRPPHDAIERLIITALSDDAVHAAQAVAALCRAAGEYDPRACGALTSVVVNAAAASDDGGRADMESAFGFVCTNLPGIESVCAIEKDPAAWTRRYPVLAVLAAPAPIVTLSDVALQTRRIRAARRCALYALYASVSALEDPTGPLLPYGAVGLRDLEQWARRWQSGELGSEASVPPLPLVGPVDGMGPTRERMFTVVAGLAPAAPLGHNDIVSLAYTEGPASLYGQLAQTRGQVAASLANAIARQLTARLTSAVLATGSSADVPRSCLDRAPDIFSLYPGTRPAVARHFRTDPNDTIDLGVLLRLPDREEENDDHEWDF
ncbi:hypothetical protein psal_cds_1192 [Pandoravirus salinus]|uniref:Uncharacterized protein n=1 Tax=Pandoravirus salinus TaxID=1349410 RepID=S4W130_9VIRU|nr:hypothetical protein psal_cds_1192 [Pandoravirus salinus]AGO85481.1 hypothetical protein psal_cds_1192 [Pandoravirus salinus]